MKKILNFMFFTGLFVLGKTFIVYGQFLDNPSFEGIPGMAITPPYWQACGAGSTPDTQPGGWGVDNKPSEGSTYLCLVCRGTGGTLPGNCEDVQQKLKKTLSPKRCYQLNIDLAYSPSMINGYNNPIKLQIYGGTTSCVTQELLWESGKVDYAFWKRLSLRLVSQSKVEYLIFKASYAAFQPYFGNIILDNLELIELPFQSIKMDTVLAKGEILKLSASKGKDYHWSSSINLSCSTCPTSTAIVKDSVTYTVTFENDEGCQIEEKFILRVKDKTEENPEMDDKDLIVPNVFTPNNDGINDYFEIKGLTPKSTLKISNRWGKIVFSTKNYENNWTGNMLPTGEYYYLFTWSKNNKTYNGWLNILR